MKNWQVLHQENIDVSNFTLDRLIKILLENRGITTVKEIDSFLHPNLETITPKTVGIDEKELKKSLKRIKQAIEKKEQIVVFGDYDVDGITASAILWETLDHIGAIAVPYIPNRLEEGYGLSIKGIENILEQVTNVKLIITVDNGIVAHEAVDFANKHGIDVIITDHHTKAETLPKAYSFVHTTQLCGAGVAYVLSKELTHPGNHISLKPVNADEDIHLELAALGTIADLVPLTGANRAIVKYGLKKLGSTKRPGLIELCKVARLKMDEFRVYDISYIMAPRLNAAGRIESAMDSLRLLCTKDPARARMLADKLELTNRERQFMLREAAQHAIGGVQSQTNLKKILIVAHEEYQEGIIGLVAGKLVEQFYRPTLVLSKGEKVSKGSARSISGFNIIEFLRSHEELFINLGGHPMAAGFTIETEKIIAMKNLFETLTETMVTDEILIRNLKIDCELPISLVTQQLYFELKKLEPFGMANYEPVFVDKNVEVQDMRILGKEGTHLRLTVHKDNAVFEAIAFGMAERAGNLKVKDKIDLVYTIDENTWNGQTKIQLKVKDFRLSNSNL